MLPQKLREQRDCHRAAVDLMETITNRLPLKDILPVNMQNAHVRSTLRSMLGVMEQALRFLLQYAHTPAYSEWEALLDTLYRLISNRSEDLLASQQRAIEGFKESMRDTLSEFHTSISAQSLRATMTMSEC